MAKIKKDVEFDESRILEAHSEFSSFGFECEVFQSLSCNEWSSVPGYSKFDFEHGGTYVDPVTEKPREFDIRGYLTMGERCRIDIAIECKKICGHAPLVVTTKPRSSKEGFFHSVGKPACLDTNIVYPVRRPVGKSISQYAVAEHGGQLIEIKNGGVYDKWSQALASCADLFTRVTRAKTQKTFPGISLVLPILVVPDETLWVISYDKNGKHEPPRRSQACSLYVNWPLPLKDLNSQVRISHLEICTVSNLRSFLWNRLDELERTAMGAEKSSIMLNNI